MRDVANTKLMQKLKNTSQVSLKLKISLKISGLVLTFLINCATIRVWDRVI